MKYALFGSAVVLALSTGAFAGAGGEKLAQAECDALWMQASPTDGKLTETAAAEFITDTKSVNPDGDTTIEQDEFRNACNQGLIKSTAAAGASSGTSGSDASETSDRTPAETNPKPLPQKDMDKGDTSDRTPTE